MIYTLLIILSWVYILFGIIGIFRFSNIYERLFASSKIDTAASITILIALIIYSGFSIISIRLFLIMIFLIITGPVSSHIIARSAYLSGIAIKKR